MEKLQEKITDIDKRVSLTEQTVIMIKETLEKYFQRQENVQKDNLERYEKREREWNELFTDVRRMFNNAAEIRGC